MLIFCWGSVGFGQERSIADIESTIEYLKLQQRRFERDAIYNESEAQRLQFLSNKDELQTAKRRWKKAAQDREMIKEIQQEIDKQEKALQQVKNKASEQRATTFIYI